MAATTFLEPFRLDPFDVQKGVNLTYHEDTEIKALDKKPTPKFSSAFKYVGQRLPKDTLRSIRDDDSLDGLTNRIAAIALDQRIDTPAFRLHQRFFNEAEIEQNPLPPSSLSTTHLFQENVFVFQGATTSGTVSERQKQRACKKSSQKKLQASSHRQNLSKRRAQISTKATKVKV